MRLADEIREYLHVALIKPARRRDDREVVIKAGEVHRGIGLRDRMPAVCSALDAGAFPDLTGVTLLERMDPTQVATARWRVLL